MVTSGAGIDVTLESGVRVVASPGEISVGIGRLLSTHGDAFIGDLIDRAMQCDHITKIDANRSRGEIAIEYDRSQARLTDMLKSLARSLVGRPRTDQVVPSPGAISNITARQNGTLRPRRTADLGDESRLVPTSPVWRLANLAAAGGCFVMSFIGLITPGIPTVPFVLATSYFLMRSSPALNERFRQSRLFGQMARDWQDRGGLQRSTKVRLLLVTFGLMSVTLLVAEISLPLLAAIAGMGSLGLWLILRLPTVSDELPSIAGPGGSIR